MNLKFVHTFKNLKKVPIIYFIKYKMFCFPDFKKLYFIIVVY